VNSRQDIRMASKRSTSLGAPGVSELDPAVERVLILFERQALPCPCGPAAIATQTEEKASNPFNASNVRCHVFSAATAL